MNSFDPDLTTTGVRCFCGYIALALFPEREPEVWGFMDEVVSRSKLGHFPQMKHIWAMFGVHVDLLTREVSWRVHNPTWRASLHSAANDDGPADCQTCAWSRRAVANAEKLGSGLATLVSAFCLGDAASLQHAFELFPSNLDEGHVLPLSMLKHSFRRRAAALELPVAVTRQITKAIEAIEDLERASVQLCFDFAVAA
jgi:hypothetical protein